jgi:hypothetical protein
MLLVLRMCCAQVDAEDKAKTAKITADKAVADKEATLAREN